MGGEIGMQGVQVRKTVTI